MQTNIKDEKNYEEDGESVGSRKKGCKREEGGKEIKEVDYECLD